MLEAKEAIENVLSHVKAYQRTCKTSKGKIRSDVKVGFFNLLPIDKRSGQSGFNKSEEFLAEFGKHQFNDIVQLIQFLFRYFKKRGTVHRYIEDSILEIIGFHEKHVDIIAGFYANLFGPTDKLGNPLTDHHDDEARLFAKQRILEVVSGDTIANHRAKRIFLPEKPDKFGLGLLEDLTKIIKAQEKGKPAILEMQCVGEVRDQPSPR